ncbi:MAG: hypothetical protein J5I53_01960 [Bradyrhizobiaceae bacterium]|nr:hypothetical protein [Bradyrhizobiaceae bacterium]
MSRLSLIVLSFTVVVTACSPWRFSLQQNADFPIEGRILTGKEHVRILGTNAFAVAAPGTVAFRAQQITDGEFDTEVLIEKGTGFDLVMRSTPFDDSTKGGVNAMRIHVSADSTVGISAGSGMVVVTTPTGSRAVPITASVKQPFRIVVTQHGRYTDVEVACTTIGRFVTPKPSTQWISVVPSNGSAVRLVDPTFREIADLYVQEAETIMARYLGR